MNQVDVTVSDIAKVGPLIDRGVAAGANVMNGVTFQLSSSNQGADQALAAAVADARRRRSCSPAAGAAHWDRS